jgi:hypothetical protein
MKATEHTMKTWDAAELFYSCVGSGRGDRDAPPRPPCDHYAARNC